MPIQNVVVNAVGVQRSVDFYTKFLDAEVVPFTAVRSTGPRE